MPKKDIDYPNLRAELDEVLDKLQSDELDVDAAVKLYERGIAITKELQAYLATAENKVTKIKTDLGK